MATAVFLVLVLPPQEGAVRKPLKEADALYERRSEGDFCEKAVAAFKKALAIDSSCEEAYWKIARACYWLGTHAKDGEKKMRIHKEGVEYAKLAVAANEESLPGHFWLGVHYALYGDARGISQSLHLVEPVIKEMEWVLRKDEKFMDGGAHRVLGRIYFKLPGVAGGDNHKAIEHLKKSIEIAPSNPVSYTFLAEIYLSLGRREDAVALLKQAVAGASPGDEPEFKEERGQARQRLKELGP